METTDDESIGFSSEATDEALDVPGVAIMHVSPPVSARERVGYMNTELMLLFSLPQPAGPGL